MIRRRITKHPPLPNGRGGAAQREPTLRSVPRHALFAKGCSAACAEARSPRKQAWRNRKFCCAILPNLGCLHSTSQAHIMLVQALCAQKICKALFPLVVHTCSRTVPEEGAFEAGWQTPPDLSILNYPLSSKHRMVTGLVPLPLRPNAYPPLAATSQPVNPFRRTPCRLSATPCAAEDPLRTSTYLDNATPDAAADRDPPPLSRLDAIPPPLLKALRKQGQQLQDTIKLGRLGVGEGLVEQIRRRWNTTEVRVVALHCPLVAAGVSPLCRGCVLTRM